MSLITENPVIDIASEQQPSIFYLDDGTAIFKVVSDPNGSVIANAGSLAIRNNGNVYAKSSSGDSAHWNLLASSGSASPGGVATNVQFNDGGSFGGDNGFVYTSDGFVGINAVSPLAQFHVNALDANTVAGLFINDTPIVDVLQVSVDNGSSVGFGIDKNARAYTANGFDVLLPASSTLIANNWKINNVSLGKIEAKTSTFNFVFGGQATANSDTDGFVYIPSIAAIPSATPTSYANTVPIRVDTLNSRLYAYFSGAWNNLTGAGATSPGSPNLSVQFNKSGVFTGDSTFTFSDSTKILDVGNIIVTQFGITNSALVINIHAGSAVEPVIIKDSGGNIRGGWSTAGAFFYRGFTSAPTNSLANDGKLFYDITGGVTSQQLVLSKNTGQYNPVITANQASYTTKRLGVWSSNSWELGDTPGFEYQSAASPNVLITAQNIAYSALIVREASTFPNAAGMILQDSASNNVIFFDASGSNSVISPVGGQIVVAQTPFNNTPAIVVVGLSSDTFARADYFGYNDLSHYVRMVCYGSGYDNSTIQNLADTGQVQTSAVNGLVLAARDASGYIRFGTGGSALTNIRASIFANGDIQINGNTTATGDTTGHFYIPSVAGTPTGVPTSRSNTVPIRIDSTGSKLYAYFSGAWNNLSGAGATSPGGSSGNLQWNNGGAFAGVAGSTVDSNGWIDLAATARSSGTNPYFSVTSPADTGLTGSSQAVGVDFDLSATRTWDTNAPSTQREFYVRAPHYASSAVTSMSRAGTFVVSGPPINGSNLTVTSPVTIWLEDGPIFIADGGSASDVAVQIAAKDNGFYGSTLSVQVVGGGVALMDWSGSTGNITIRNSTGLIWGSSGLASADSGIYRAAAAVLKFTTSSSGGGGTWSALANVAAQITSDQNNYAAGSNKSYFQTWNSDASRNVTGFSNSQVNGQVHLIVNVGTNNIVLKNEDAGSTAANRFTCSTGADITLAANEAADIIYHNATSRWLVYKR